jgi:hypothetical protein
MQHRNNDAERLAQYRQEAAACAKAALTTTIAEIKQAYLDLEQGWLCLAPKPENSSTVSAELNIAIDVNPKLQAPVAQC